MSFSMSDMAARQRELKDALARRRALNVPHHAWEPWWTSVSHWGLHLWPGQEGKPWVNL